MRTQIDPYDILTKPAQVSIPATTPTLLSLDPHQRELALFNLSDSATVYIGTDATVTDSNGFPVPPLTGYDIKTTAGQPIYLYAHSALKVAQMSYGYKDN